MTLITNETYIKIFSLLSRKLTTPIFSSVLFGIMYAFIYTTPTAMREDNVYYFGFFEIILFVILYTIPIYILLAIPFSIFIDTYGKTASLPYYKISILFSLAGIVTGIGYSILFSPNDWKQVIVFGLYGLISANLFLLFTARKPRI